MTFRLRPLTYQPDNSGIGSREEEQLPAEVSVLYLGLTLLLQHDVRGAHDARGPEAGPGAARGAGQLRHGRHARAPPRHRGYSRVWVWVIVTRRRRISRGSFVTPVRRRRSCLQRVLPPVWYWLERPLPTQMQRLLLVGFRRRRALVVVFITSWVPDTLILLAVTFCLFPAGSGSDLVLGRPIELSRCLWLCNYSVILLHFMEEVVEHVPPLNVLLSWTISMMLLTSSCSILPISLGSLFLSLGSSSRPVSALIPRSPELSRFLGSKADGLRLDAKELLPSRSLLGGDSGRRLPLGRGRGRLLLTPWRRCDDSWLLPGDEWGTETICLDAETDHADDKCFLLGVNYCSHQPIMTRDQRVIRGHIRTNESTGAWQLTLDCCLHQR